MKKTAMCVAAALLALSQSSVAQQKPANETTVKPGTEATGAMSKEVPQMKGGCDKTAEVDTKAPGTAATEAMSDQVPTMTADAKECADQGKNKTKVN